MNLRTGELISVVTSTGADIDVHASWHDEGSNTNNVPGSDNTKITTATTTTVLEGPRGSGCSKSRRVATLVLRNIDSSSNTVTVKHTDADGVAVEIFKATLVAGAQMEYDENNGWTVMSVAPSGYTLLTATADTANSAADTLANVAGLTIAVDAGDTYKFRAVCVYAADATTSGSRWTINGPAASAGTGYRSNYGLTTTSETVNNGLGAVQLPAAANATSPAAAASNVAVVEGIYIPSTAGTFAVQFAAEAGTITAKAGSTLEITKVIDA